MKRTAVYKCKYCGEIFAGRGGYDLSHDASVLVINRIGTNGLDRDTVPLYETHRCSEYRIGLGEIVGFTIFDSEDVDDE